MKNAGPPFRYPLSSNPIFWTIQGEGHMRGSQMCFIRLAGCSVGCPGCDTDYRKKEMATPEEIAQRADDVTPPEARERWAWITGGEPTDHNLDSAHSRTAGETLRHRACHQRPSRRHRASRLALRFPT